MVVRVSFGPPMPKYLLGDQDAEPGVGKRDGLGSAQKFGAPPESSPRKTAFGARRSRRTARLVPAENVSRPIKTKSCPGRSISGSDEEPEQVAIAAGLASAVVAEVEHQPIDRMLAHGPFDLVHRLGAVLVHDVVLHVERA